MVGRKSALDPSVVIDAILLFKSKVITTNEHGEKSK